MTKQKLPAGLWVYKKRSGGYSQEFDPDYCAASVAFGGRRVDFHQCTRKWKVEKRGHRWCTQHDPDKIEERKKKARAKYEAQMDARMAPYRRIKKLEERVRELEAENVNLKKELISERFAHLELLFGQDRITRKQFDDALAELKTLEGKP